MPYNPPYVPEELGSPLLAEPAAPAAGADFSTALPANETWILNTFSARLTTAVAVANRMPAVVITSPAGHILLYTDQAFTQAASLIETYIFVNQGGRQVVGTNNRILDSLGKFFIPPQSTIAFHVTGIQAADQVDLVTYTYQRYLVRP